jgi:hypothetical protein
MEHTPSDAHWPLPAVLQRPTPDLRDLQRRLAAFEARAESDGTATWLVPQPPNRAPFEDVPFPVDGRVGDQPVPNLARLRPTRWLRAMASTGEETRRFAAASAGHDAEGGRLALLAEVVLAFAGANGRWRHAEAEAAVPVIGDVVVPRPRRSGRQVNVRLRDEEHAVVEKAAARLGTTVTALVRAFALEGAQQVLERAARARATA